MTEGTYPKSDYADIGSSLENYTNSYGWYGSDVYSCGGYMRIGSYGKSGSVQTPNLDFSGSNGVFTCAMHTVSYPGKSVNYNVTLKDITSGATLENYSLKATKTETPVTLVFHHGNANCRIYIATTNERLFVNDFRILKKEVTEEEAWAAGPKNWVIDSIAETHCKVTGLAASRTYKVACQALAAEELKNSLESSVLAVTTAGSVMMGDVNMDSIVNVSDVTVLINEILGQPIGNFNAIAADLNSDGVLNVTDVTHLINLILGI